MLLITLTSSVAMGYMLALTAMLGALFGFINSVQQVFADVFSAPALLGVVVAGWMAAASYLNSRIFEPVHPDPNPK